MRVCGSIRGVGETPPLALLESIRSYMGVGNIAITQRGTVKYSVRNLNDLTSVIIPFF